MQELWRRFEERGEKKVREQVKLGRIVGDLAQAELWFEHKDELRKFGQDLSLKVSREDAHSGIKGLIGEGNDLIEQSDPPNDPDGMRERRDFWLRSAESQLRDIFHGNKVTRRFDTHQHQVHKRIETWPKGGIKPHPSKQMEAFRQAVAEVVDELEDYRFLVEVANSEAPRSSVPTSEDKYVNTLIIEALESMDAPGFYPARLVAVCRELNSNWEHGNLFSVANLVRTVVDCVAPAFGDNDFGQAMSQHSIRSFREGMGHLDKLARKTDDGLLHWRINQNRPLPLPQSVDYRGPINELLAQVVKELEV